jgi:protein-disulfide isomerase
MEHTTAAAKSAFEKYLTPISVLVGALVIGGAVYWSGQNPNLAGPANPGEPSEREVQAALAKMAPVTADDHIRGSLDADVIIVEYSDTECPFCKVFHGTMNQIVSEYDGNQVAWVYRHFPLDQLHQKARHEAVALECAAEQGGNDAFWAYTDRLYEITTSNDGLDEAELPRIAAFAGLDVAAFTSCLSSTRHDARIQADVENAIASGGRGTPWSIIVAKDGTKMPVNGAVPVAQLQQMIEEALAR